MADRMRRADQQYRALRAAEGEGDDPCTGVGIAGQADACATKCLHAHVSAYLAGVDDPVGAELLACGGRTVTTIAVRASSPQGSRGSSVAEGPLRRLAAVDIGTVTTRLLIADVRPPAITEVSRSTDITHLGEGLTETGRLDPVAMERVASVIARYSRELATAGAESVVAVTTSAARDASNGDDLLDLLESCGIRPEIISGEREAALSFAGATSGRAGTDLLVVDVGGGSTELVSGEASEGRGSVGSACSLDVGSRRITEMFLASDPPTRDELAAARTFIMAAVAPAIADLSSPPAQMISVAGTATTLSAIRLGLEQYDSELIHGSVLTDR